MLKITSNISIPDHEIHMFPIRAQGAGGQNINKVSTAIHLRFDINASSLPPRYKQRMLNLKDQRINNQGIVIIKAQNYRNQEKNRLDSLTRLQKLIKSVTVERKIRLSTKPTAASKTRRLDSKCRRGKIKVNRRKVSDGRWPE